MLRPVTLCVGLLFCGEAFSKVDIDRASLQRELDDYSYFSKIPGTVLSICQGGECFELTSGLVDPDGSTPMPSDPKVRIGSLSKTMVATLIMKAREEGLINLDDLLGDYLPQYEKWSRVTIKQLLRMESGIPPYLFTKEGGIDLFKDVLLGRQDIYQPGELLNGIKDKELEFEPGEKSEYNNSNYILLGLILEQLYDEKLADLIHKGIVKPLGLEHTYLDMGARNPDLTKGFLQSHHTGMPSYLRILVPPSLKRSDRTFDVTYGLASTKVWAAGGVVSTPREMSLFVRGLLSGRIVGSESIEAMKDFVDGSVAGNLKPYGLGLMRSDTPYGSLFGHGGVGVGYQTATYHLEEEDLTINLVQNSGPAGSDAFFNTMLRRILGSTSAYKSFSKDEGLEEYHLNNGLHMRVVGEIEEDGPGMKALFTSMVGFGFDFKRFVLGQSYNKFEILSVNTQKHDGFMIKMKSKTAFDYFFNPPDSIPFSLTFIDRAAIEKAQSQNGVIEFHELDVERSPIYTFTGYTKVDDLGNEYHCAKRVLDMGQPLLVQALLEGGGLGAENQQLKMVGNIPLRNYQSADRALLRLFDLEPCPYLPL